MLLFWLSAVSPVPQEAQPNWRALGQSKDGTSFFVDDSTIISKSDGVAEVWTRRDNLPGSKYAREKILISFNCHERTSKYIAAISYLASGSIGNDRYKPEKRYLPVIPNSIDWVTMEHVCKLMKPTPDAAPAL
ncbi:surface-adhesin E family protein [Sphingomonas elodea]|uniref:surface-adhesin E family protein n=1 Tax=Sphingomonas elodea TaxID=179878 RepID=UPI00111066C6|nr:surface-adhesin E family protein [Sphingomonas elodea]